MKNRFKIKISERIADHLIQAVLIFISVLFAFWLSDYRSNSDDRKRSKLILEYVLREFEKNQETLVHWLPYHEELSDKSSQFLTNKIDSSQVFNLYNIANREKGIFKSIITSNAKEQFENNANISLDVSVSITRIYAQQEYVENALVDVLDFLKQRELYDNNLTEVNYQVFSQLITELYYQEKALVVGYQNGIEAIREHL